MQRLQISPNHGNHLPMTPGEWGDRKWHTALGMNLLRKDQRRAALRASPAHEIECGLKLGDRAGPGDRILGEPQTADQPWIAGDLRCVAADTLVRIVFVTGHPTHLGLDPQLLTDGAHRAVDHRRLSTEDAEAEGGEC